MGCLKTEVISGRKAKKIQKRLRWANQSGLAAQRV